MAFFVNKRILNLKKLKAVVNYLEMKTNNSDFIISFYYFKLSEDFFRNNKL
jgi:hypothetical protein